MKAGAIGLAGSFLAASLVVAAGYAASAFADAATYWVATDGSDAPETAGTEEAPFLTLPNALAHAGDGDTVKIKAGTYDIPLAASKDDYWAVVDKAVTIEGVGGASEVFFDGGNRNVTPIRLANADAKISGITFRRFKSNSTWNLYMAGLVQVDDGTVADCVFTDSTCYYCAIVKMNNGTVTNCVFRNLESTDSNSWGGGALLYQGSPSLVDCLFDNCKAKQGAGFYVRSNASGATVRDCRVVNCKGVATTRGYTGTVVVEAGLVANCLVATNTAAATTATGLPASAGVVVRGGTLRNCLVTRNRTSDGTSGWVAGGIYQSAGTVENCTVCNNALVNSGFYGQGMYVGGSSAKVRNTIVAFNGGYGVFEDECNFMLASGTAEHCDTYPLAAGEGNIAADPLFDGNAASDGILSPMSDCINTGVNQEWMTAATDFFGNPRLYGSVDIGCQEVDLSKAPFSCIFLQDGVSGIAPYEVRFTGKIISPPGDVMSVIWDFGDGTIDSTSGLSAKHTYETYGNFDVTLTVVAGGKISTYAVPGAVSAGTDKTYVATDGANIWPYATPETAATNLADAVAALSFRTSMSVSEVEVAPGRYFIPATASKDTPWVRVDRAVRIRSKEGPGRTFIDGGWAGGGATSPVRFAFFLSNSLCSLEGFTVERIYSNVDYGTHRSGAVHVEMGSVSNCVIRNSSFFFEGPLSLKSGTARDCVISNNVSRDGWTCGGVALEGPAKLYDSLVCDNRGKEASGLWLAHASAIVSNCVFRGNVCEATTRGSYGAITVTYGLMTHCVISNNTGFSGAIHMKNAAGTVRNCLIAGNSCVSSSISGGGVYLVDGTLENCTLAGNVSTLVVAGQGLEQVGGTVRNCIIACNGKDGTFADVSNCSKTGGTMEYTCAYPETAGTGNTYDDPKFSDLKAGDYTLALTSPLKDQAQLQPWMTGALDLRGYARVIGDGPEPGCYEIDPSQVPFGCDITVTGGQLGLIPFETAFTGEAINPPGEVTAYEWNFGDGRTGEGKTVTNTYTSAGKYTVTLTVRCGEASAVKTAVDLVSAGCDHAYVKPDGTPVWPYDTEETAATNIQDAVDAILLPTAESHGTVYVLPGTYGLRKQGGEATAADVVLSRPITVVSTAGRDETFIDGRLQSFSRGVIMSHDGASFRGFTFRNIRSYISDKAGCGIFQMAGGTLSDCVFTNNFGTWGAPVGVNGGAVENCVFAGNSTSDSAAEGGAMRITKGMVRDCTFTGNSSVYGAAIWVKGSSAVVSNCVIAANTGVSVYRGLGGAAVELVSGLVTHCVITGNTGYAAGGVTTWNVYINDKSQSPVLRNCLIARNKAYGYDKTTSGAGGVYHGAGTVESCTIADNVALTDGVGGDLMAARASDATGSTYELVNTIAYGSAAGSALGPLAPDHCLIGVDPRFRNAAKGDYRLGGASAAIDAAEGRAWMTDACDLSGGVRVWHGAPDIGCYERVAVGTVFLLK